MTIADVRTYECEMQRRTNTKVSACGSDAADDDDGPRSPAKPLSPLTNLFSSPSSSGQNNTGTSWFNWWSKKPYGTLRSHSDSIKLLNYIFICITIYTVHSLFSLLLFSSLFLSLIPSFDSLSHPERRTHQRSYPLWTYSSIYLFFSLYSSFHSHTRTTNSSNMRSTRYVLHPAARKFPFFHTIFESFWNLTFLSLYSILYRTPYYTYYPV